MKLTELCTQCKDAVENAAYESYSDGSNPDSFRSCYAEVKLKGTSEIDITYTKGEYEVLVYHENGNSTPLLEKFLAGYLSANATPENEWQEACDSDDWRDCDPGCDPAFPHYGDYERYRYGSYPYFR